MRPALWSIISDMFWASDNQLRYKKISLKLINVSQRIKQYNQSCKLIKYNIIIKAKGYIAFRGSLSVFFQICTDLYPHTKSHRHIMLKVTYFLINILAINIYQLSILNNYISNIM